MTAAAPATGRGAAAALARRIARRRRRRRCRRRCGCDVVVVVVVVVVGRVDGLFDPRRRFLGVVVTGFSRGESEARVFLDRDGDVPRRFLRARQGIAERGRGVAQGLAAFDVRAEREPAHGVDKLRRRPILDEFPRRHA